MRHYVALHEICAKGTYESCGVPPAMREVNFHKFQQLLLPIWGARSTRSRYQVLTGMPELQSLDSRDVLTTVLALWSADVDAHDLSEQTFDRYRGLAQQYVNYTYNRWTHHARRRCGTL